MEEAPTSGFEAGEGGALEGSPTGGPGWYAGGPGRQAMVTKRARQVKTQHLTCSER
jgi:hypothetical protein